MRGTVVIEVEVGSEEEAERFMVELLDSENAGMLAGTVKWWWSFREMLGDGSELERRRDERESDEGHGDGDDMVES